MNTFDHAPLLLAILDGWGVAPPSPFNAVHVADTPNMDRWWRDYPATTLTASAGMVGLPAGQMGNSEVGHLNIGAGRVVYQDFTRINRAIDSGDFFDNPALTGIMDQAKKSGGAVHLLGLVSDGGVHSHLDHLAALLLLASRRGVTRLFVHAFTDGRDTAPSSGAGFIRTLQDILARGGLGKIASIAGRYWAMDRDNRWDRVARAWGAMVDGVGLAAPAADAAVVMEAAYRRGETDEFVQPTVLCGENGLPLATIGDGDSLVFFNFRADRVRQLVRAFIDDDFSGFARTKRPRLGQILTFTSYDKGFHLPVAFLPQGMEKILGEVVAGLGLSQLRIAETEKYAHVTYFFNGGREEPFAGEERILVPSPRQVATYDLLPEMSAPEVTARLLARLETKPPALTVLNFANGDMVGHTGVMAAAVEACAAVDRCLGQVVARLLALGGTVCITADHGNAETMLDPLACAPHTAHTLNPVPFLLVDERHRSMRMREGGALMDIAPTILDLMGIEKPAAMEGTTLLLHAAEHPET